MVVPNVWHEGLERNLRKLLFNTYTVNFGVDYYQKTVSPDLQKKIKGVIQAKGNEEKKQIERLKKFFYSMEFSDIQTLLFTKKWTTVEEESKAEFLSKPSCHTFGTTINETMQAIGY